MFLYFWFAFYEKLTLSLIDRRCFSQEDLP
jgi:hypothetical protein